MRGNPPNTGEKEIRRVLKDRHLRHHRGRRDVLVIDELGLANARNRIDLAVFNGNLHGYEIKSTGDTLERLSDQLTVYRASLQKLTLVVAARHIDAASALAPGWCGLIQIVEGPRGGLSLSTRRRASANPEFDPFMFAHLLWRPEVQMLLQRRGLSTSDLRRPRKQLYRRLADEMPIRELTSAVKVAMMSRVRWRDRLQRS